MIRNLALFAALALIFTIPWETAITIASLGTITRLIGFGAVGVWIVSVVVTSRLRKLHPFHLALLFFMLINVASIFWTVSADLTTTRIKTYMQLALLSWLLWDLLVTPASLRQAMQVFIFGAYLAIASQLINLAGGQIISAYETGRYSGMGQNANEFALILSLCLPVAWYLVLTAQRGSGANLLKVLNIAFIPLALIATLLTASRTALVTDLPGMLYIAATLNRIKPVYRALVFFAVVIAMLAIVPMIPQTTLDRLSTFGSSVAENDLGGRSGLWIGSLLIFLDHPLLGVGSNALSAPGQLGAYAHNTFFSVMAELGLVGFLLFSAVVVIVLYHAFYQPKPQSVLWITVMAVWMIGAFTLTWEYTKTTWFFFSLVIISAGACEMEEEPRAALSMPMSPLLANRR